MEKFGIFCFWLHCSSSFQWCTPKSGIGNGFGVKPKIAFFQFFQKCVFSPPSVFRENNGKWRFWYWWLVFVLASSQSNKNASKKLRGSRKKFYSNDKKLAQNGQKKQKKSIFSNISHANIAIFELTWKILWKPFLQCFACRRTFSGSRVVAEKTPKKATNRLLRSLNCLRLKPICRPFFFKDVSKLLEWISLIIFVAVASVSVDHQR